MEKEILAFISRFTKYGNSINKCFKERNCYYFHCILKSKFTNVEAYYDKLNDHVISKIGDNYYDINGRYNPNLDDIIFYDGINTTLKQQLE